MTQQTRRLRDEEWVKQSFLLPEHAITDADMVRRTLTTAAFKFTDTTIGGNFAINTPPQYTRYADIKVGGQPNERVFMRVGGSRKRSRDDGDGSPYPKDPRTGLTPKNKWRRATASRGMGRYYSEALDDNGQYVTMRFGVPEYNSLSRFFATFYDHDASTLARTGRGGSLLYMIGQGAGIMLALPFWPAIQGGRVIRFLTQTPASKFYYMKPAMPLYWSAVSKIINGISINLGLVPPSLSPKQFELYQNPGMAWDKGVAERYHQWAPDVINEYGIIDPFAVATRAQRLSNRYNEEIRESVGSRGWEGINTKINRWLEMQIDSGRPEHVNLDAYVRAYADLPENQPKPDSSDGATAETVDNRERYSLGTGFWSFLRGERRDGASFVTFRIDFTNTADESFQNSTRESDIAQKINSMSSSNRSIRFNVAEGNLGDGAIAGLIETTLGMAKDVVMGVADGLQISGLAALAGSALVDIPKMWDASTANLPRLDFTIQLRSPYGNVMSRMRNLFLPLSMLLAGALPLSTGRHSYTSPFLCEAYCRGRAAIRLGMIESLSITRGVGNLGWNQEDQPLGIDVRVSIVDMSSIVHMPIASFFNAVEGAITQAGAAVGGTTGAIIASALTKSAWDEDNSFTDYLAVLGSLSFQDFVYPTSRWRINVANQMAEFRSWRSPARWANWIMGTFPGRVVNAFSENTDRYR